MANSRGKTLKSEFIRQGRSPQKEAGGKKSGVRHGRWQRQAILATTALLWQRCLGKTSYRKTCIIPGCTGVYIGSAAGLNIFRVLLSRATDSRQLLSMRATQRTGPRVKQRSIAASTRRPEPHVYVLRVDQTASRARCGVCVSWRESSSTAAAKTGLVITAEWVQRENEPPLKLDRAAHVPP